MCDQLTIASTFLQRLKGWLGKRRPPDGGGILFRRCNSVHTIGMRFSIDVVFLDEHDCVIGVETLKPLRYSRQPKAKAVMELAANAASGLSLGSFLEVKPSSNV